MPQPWPRATGGPRLRPPRPYPTPAITRAQALPAPSPSRCGSAAAGGGAHACGRAVVAQEGHDVRQERARRRERRAHDAQQLPTRDGRARRRAAAELLNDLRMRQPLQRRYGRTVRRGRAGGRADGAGREQLSPAHTARLGAASSAARSARVGARAPSPRRRAALLRGLAASTPEPLGR
jgi:hypothetical protein